jgi:hypothetical protein
MTNLCDRQRAPVPFPNRGQRLRNSPGGAVADIPRRVVGAQADMLEGDPRYPGYVNDSMIRRDRTAWYPSDARSGVGTVAVDWTAAGPPRPELHMRNVTVRRMAGTDQTRAFANPADPSVGLHTNPKIRPSGNIERFKAGSAGMKHGRTDRLSPARYTGQSYSQTTLLQGATSTGAGRRRK